MLLIDWLVSLMIEIMIQVPNHYYECEESELAIQK